MGFVNLCKNLSIWLFIIGFIGAFLIANKVSTTTVVLYEMTYSNDITKEVKDSGIYYTTLISTWISSGILSLFIFGLGKIVEYLYNINLYINKEEKDKRQVIEEPNNNH